MVRSYTHLFHNIVYVMFSFVVVLRGMILILVITIVTLVIGPTMTVSSNMLRTPATASSSVLVCLISLKIGFVVGAVLIMIILICTSQKPLVLKLTLIILRSLASASLCDAFKLLITALTIKRSVALILTWGSVIIIVVIIIRTIIQIGSFCLLVLWWVLSLTLRFPFWFTFTSDLFWFCPFKWWGISSSSLSIECVI